MRKAQYFLVGAELFLKALKFLEGIKENHPQESYIKGLLDKLNGDAKPYIPPPAATQLRADEYKV